MKSILFLLCFYIQAHGEIRFSSDILKSDENIDGVLKISNLFSLEIHENSLRIRSKDAKTLVSFPPKSVIHSVVANQEKTALVTLVNCGSSFKLVIFTLKEGDFSERSIDILQRENLVLTKLYSVSKSGRFAIGNIGIIEPNKKGFTVKYDLRIFDTLNKKLLNNGVDQWHTFRVN